MEKCPVKAELVLDLKRITAEVAARHGMLVSQEDPAMLLVTMNEVVLQQVLGSLEARTEKIVAGYGGGLPISAARCVGKHRKRSAESRNSGA